MTEPEFRLTLPMPPSANALYKRVLNRHGKRPLTDAYRSWLSEAGWRITQHRHLPMEPLSGPLGVSIDLPVDRKRDADNAIKPILDLLKHQHIIVDDRWVDELLVRRVPVTEPLTVGVWRIDGAAAKTPRRRAAA